MKDTEVAIKKIDSLFQRNRCQGVWEKWSDGPRNFYEHTSSSEVRELIKTNGKALLGDDTSRNIGQLRRKIINSGKSADFNTYDALRLDNLNCCAYREMGKVHKVDEYDPDFTNYNLLPLQHALEKAYADYKDKLDVFNVGIEPFNMMVVSPLQKRLIDAYNKYEAEHKIYLEEVERLSAVKKVEKSKEVKVLIIETKPPKRNHFLSAIFNMFGVAIS